MQLISSIYVLLIPFFDVPRWGIDGIALSFFPAIVILVYSILISQTPFPREKFILFFIFIAIYTMSFLINFFDLDSRSWRHIIYYLVTFAVYYMSVFYSVRILGITRFRRYIYIGLWIIASIGTIELILFYIYGFDSYANFLNHGGNVGTFAGFLPRMRSLFNEPSHLALYVVSVAPIVWSYGYIARLLIVYILIATFSTSMIIGVTLSYVFVILYKTLNLRRIRISKLICYVVIFCALSAVVIFYFNIIFDKAINISERDVVRYNALIKSIPYIWEGLFLGNGPAFYYTYYEYGLFNWYLQLLIESGLLGICSMLFFLFSHYRNIRRSLGVVGIFFFVAALIQYTGMNHYYIPGIWVLMAYSKGAMIMSHPIQRGRS
jgi:O-Antigen ligase.